MMTKTNSVHWILGAIVAAVALANAPAFAAAPPPPVPATLQQQGRILDKDGVPVSSKVHFVFVVYNDAKASKPANVLWKEEQDITLDDGYFSTELGLGTAITSGIFDGSTRYLGVTVGSDDEMAPRQTISSVPYALVAGSAATAAAADSASRVPFTGLTGLPAPCAAGQYLKGFAANGTPACVNPVLNCHTVFGADVASGTFGFVGCPTGEVAVGGGCSASVALTSSAFYHCKSLCYCVFGQPCPGSSDWACSTATAGTITPSVQCCTIQ